MPILRRRGELGLKVEWTRDAADWAQDRVQRIQDEQGHAKTRALAMVAAELEVVNGKDFSGGSLRDQLKRWK